MADRGYIVYKPRDMAAYWLRCVREVLAQYRDDWPLTVRQVFYRLVASYNYPKTEADYKTLGKIIARGRRASPVAPDSEFSIPFSAIRDDTMRSIDPNFFTDEEDFGQSMLEAAKQFQLDRLDGQEWAVELWCEAAGMIPIMASIARPYGVKVSSGGGYDSVTSKHLLAVRARDRFRERDQGTLILHVGDFDGSGENMCDVLHDDVLMMFAQWTGREHIDKFSIKRVALTDDQVIAYDVITAPPKPTDSRTRKFVARHPELVNDLGTTDIAAQLEALTPPQLRELVTSVIEENLNMATFNARLEEEKETRENLQDILSEINWNGRE